MPHRQRFDAIDILRGIAVVWMTVFHFCFDLNHFGHIRQDFYADPFWTGQRSAIITLFLLCAGMGQAIAVEQSQYGGRFARRWAQIAGCALLVSAGSYWMFPRSFIYFGVLHCIAAALVIVRLTASWGRWLWLAGAAMVALQWIAIEIHADRPWLDFLNAPAWNWLGFIGRKPVTEDYVPLIPWLGVMWWGVAAGQWLLRRHPAWLAAEAPRATAPLAWLGRWSLAWYMLHQPVLIGALTAWAIATAR